MRDVGGMMVVRMDNRNNLRIVRPHRYKNDNTNTKLILAIIILLFVCGGIGTLLYFFVFNKELNKEENNKIIEVSDKTTKHSTESDEELKKILNENKRLDEMIERMEKENEERKKKKEKKMPNLNKKQKNTDEDNSKELKEKETIKTELMNELNTMKNKLINLKKTADASQFDNIDKAILGVNSYASMIQSKHMWNVMYETYKTGGAVWTTLDYVREFFSDGYSVLTWPVFMSKSGAATVGSYAFNTIKSFIGFGGIGN